MFSILPFNRTMRALCALGMAGCAAFLASPLRADVIASGTFVTKESGIEAKGAFEVRKADGKFSLVIKDDFRVSEGPDLYFAFHPLAWAQITGSNAKTSALRVEPGLKSLAGAQSYALPDDFDAGKYPTLIVHCWKYDHLYAAASVTKAAATAIASVTPKVPSEPVARNGFRFDGKGLVLDREVAGGSLGFGASGKSFQSRISLRRSGDPARR